MLFSSPSFLFLFLPIILLLYYIIPSKGKNVLLLAGSLFFYTWGEQELVLVMLTSVVTDYVSGLVIDKGHRRWGLALSLCVNIGLLAYFKYANFAFENYLTLLEALDIENGNVKRLPHITLPLGISFYTFQTLSYTIDVYRGEVKANRNFINFATYVTLFPQLIAGPIVRYRDIHLQLQDRRPNTSQFSEGISRFIIGLGKKMIIANTLGVVGDAAFGTPTSELSIGFAWLGVIAFGFQIYFDFSGYSDMAIGLGKMLGFEFPENFFYPYISRSIREFWRRWHITLSTWFRDYVFFPMGGSRVSPLKVYFNILFLFFVIGVWHGASWNMIGFGVFHGVFTVLERIFDRIVPPKRIPLLSHIYTIWTVLMSYVIFKTDSMGHTWAYLQVMYGQGLVGWEGVYPYLNAEVGWISLLALIFCLPVYPLVQRKFNIWYHDCPLGLAAWGIVFKLFLLGLLVLSIAYVAADTYNPFIYFRF